MHFANSGTNVNASYWVIGMNSLSLALSLSNSDQNAGVMAARLLSNVPDEVGGLKTLRFTLTLSGTLTNATNGSYLFAYWLKGDVLSEAGYRLNYSEIRTCKRNIVGDQCSTRMKYPFVRRSA